MSALLQSHVAIYECYRGKVRDVYDLEDGRLVIVATDRISAFDHVLPTGIPDKGRVLTQMTLFWLDLLNPQNHLISTKVDKMGPPFIEQRPLLEGRSMLVQKTTVVPIEFVVRGYLVGSGWKDYQKTGSVCGIPLQKGLQEAQLLPEPIFTPATKETTGHDINISFETMSQQIGRKLADNLRNRSLSLYRRAAKNALKRGIIIADTKFEFGHLPDGKLILIDEVLTPDSSRFWPADQYELGKNPPSYDKQFVRDWLEEVGWDKNSPPPPLPADIVEKTRQKYIQAFECLTGKTFQ